MDGTHLDVASVDRIAELRETIEERIRAVIPYDEPASLYAPSRYVLNGGGKRFRPVLLLLVAEAYGVEVEEALPAALAFEVFHNFTLVHDDIMDHADTRRGRPTVHRTWDESTAILCGDYLMALSMELLDGLRGGARREVRASFYGMIRKLCEGQALDKAFESRTDVKVDEYLSMIDLKTGALLETVFKVGGLMGEAPEAHLPVLEAIGRHVGRAFQVQDDLLDLTADDARWGKMIGGDLVEGKKTYILLQALETATGDEAAWFQSIIARGGLPPEQVPEARHRMERLGILDDAARAVRDHSAHALDGLQTLPATPAVDIIGWLILKMQARHH